MSSWRRVLPEVTGKLLMNPRETRLLLAHLLVRCWGIAAAGRRGLISQDGPAREVSVGHGGERIIAFHLLLEQKAAVGLPTWGLTALTAPRPTAIFPGVRVSLAITPGKLSVTLCLAPQRISGGRGRRRAATCLSAMALSTQPGPAGSLGCHPRVCVWLCLRWVAIQPDGGPIPSPSLGGASGHREQGTCGKTHVY